MYYWQPSGGVLKNSRRELCFLPRDLSARLDSYNCPCKSLKAAGSMALNHWKGFVISAFKAEVSLVNLLGQFSLLKHKLLRDLKELAQKNLSKCPQPTSSKERRKSDVSYNCLISCLGPGGLCRSCR